jgi:hypothetical protein
MYFLYLHLSSTDTHCNLINSGDLVEKIVDTLYFDK